MRLGSRKSREERRVEEETKLKANEKQRKVKDGKGQEKERGAVDN